MIMDSVSAVFEPAAIYKFRAKTEEEKVGLKIVKVGLLKAIE